MNRDSSEEEAENPFEAPAVRPIPATPDLGDPWSEMSRESAESTRQEYVSHEAAVKAVGKLNYAGVVGFGIMASGMLVIGLLASFEGTRIHETSGIDGPATMLNGIIYCGVAALAYSLGYGLGRLQPWARWLQAICAGIAVLFFVTVLCNVVGLVIFGHIASLMFSSKSAVVFSAEYQSIIQRTPRIEAEANPLYWILPGVIFVLFTLWVVGAMIVDL
jgi:hypothetical protein